MNNKMLVSALVGLALAPLANAASPGFTVSATVGGAPTGVNKVNFDNLNLGSAMQTAVGPNGSIDLTFTGDAQVVQGSLALIYAAPFLSGNNGDGFGPGGTDQPNGLDTTKYLTSGALANLGSVTMSFGAPKQYLGLLWGSVDGTGDVGPNATGLNTLTFYLGAALVGTVTGADVDAIINGDQGLNGTRYVNIDAPPFDRVVATSSLHAFEFDNVAYNTAQICLVAECVETNNPSGKNIPTAGQNPKSGQNPDGFYQLLATSCNPGPIQIYVKDSAEGPCGGAFQAGPYAPGTKLKLTQSPGQQSIKKGAGDIFEHVNTKGDPVLVAVQGGIETCHLCFLPPLPK